MSRRALPAFGLVLGGAIAALLALAVTSDRRQAFTLGVRADAAVVKLRPGDEVCQRPIEVLERFDRVRIQLGTYARPASPYSLELRSNGSARQVARATVRRGYEDSVVQTVLLSREVAEGQVVAVCIRNSGRQRLAVYGSSDLSNRASTSYLNGEGTGADLMLVFDFPDGRSELELLPAIIRRASLFHGGWASSAAYWVLLALLVGALTAMPALALRSALGRPSDAE
jgi:hypothetical protein